MRLIIVFLLSLILITSGCSLINTTEDEPLLQKSPIAVAFINWNDATGLSKIFEFEEETISSHTYSLTLKADLLEVAIQDKYAVDKLYKRLFAKLVSVTNLSPKKVSLKIISQINDEHYQNCGYPISVSREISMSTMTDEKLVTKKEQFFNRASCFSSRELSFEDKQMISNKAKAFSVTNDNILMSKGINTGLTIDKLEQFLKNKYESKGGVVLKDSSSNDTYITVTVKNIKNEVIKKYWEKLQIIAILNKDKAKLNIILDGQYGSGFFTPSSRGYSDMEPIYKTELEEYSNALSSKIREIK